MNGFSSLVLAGNMIRDPDLKYTPDGTPIAEFGIAVNSKKKGEDVVHYFDVTAFGKTAEVIGQYLTKGRPVAIEGYLEQQRWETQDGQKRSKIVVIANRMHFLPDGKQRDGEKPNGE